MSSEGRACADCGGDVSGIVKVLRHSAGCSPVLRAEDLTSSERGTLMYVESCLVDERGRLDYEKMNHEDFQNLKLFQAAGVLVVEDDEGRVDSSVHSGHGMHKIVTEFTDEAWDLARDCRQMRAVGLIERDVDIGDAPGDGDD